MVVDIIAIIGGWGNDFMWGGIRSNDLRHRAQKRGRDTSRILATGIVDSVLLMKYLSQRHFRCACWSLGELRSGPRELYPNCLQRLIFEELVTVESKMSSRKKTGEQLMLKYHAKHGPKRASALWSNSRQAEAPGLGGSVRGEPRTRTIDDIFKLVFFHICFGRLGPQLPSYHESGHAFRIHCAWLRSWSLLPRGLLM